MVVTMRVLSLFLLIIFYFTKSCHSISFHLPPDAKKCIRDEVHKNVLVVGNYEVEEITSLKTNIEVRRSHDLTPLSRDICR